MFFNFQGLLYIIYCLLLIFDYYYYYSKSDRNWLSLISTKIFFINKLIKL